MTQRFKGKVVVITEASERSSGILGGARPTSEDDTATTFELFFDLVYVFAMTQVTGYMVHAHDALGVFQGLLVLALLWWTWCVYAWLGNQARADTGVVRGAMAVAMAALFVVALTIPEAWDDAEGGLDGPLVLVGAYLLVRCVHLSVYALAARGDPGLRRQLAISWGPTVAGAVLLMAGVFLGGSCRRCTLPAPSSWTGAASTSPRERATGASTARPTGPSATACSSYSLSANRLSPSGSAPLASRSARRCSPRACSASRRLCACGGCTSTWSPVPRNTGCATRRAKRASGWRSRPTPTGISRSSPASGAVGVEGVLAHAGDGEPLGLFYAAALYGGFALYLAGHLLFKQRMYAALSVLRLVTVGVLLLALPAVAFLPPLVGLAGLVLVIGVVIGVETRRYAALRAGVRPG